MTSSYSSEHECIELQEPIHSIEDVCDDRVIFDVALGGTFQKHVAYTLHTACLKSFSQLYQAIKTSQSATQHESRQFGERLASFYLWGRNLEISGIQNCLNNDQKLAEAVLVQIIRIARCLIVGFQWLSQTQCFNETHRSNDAMLKKILKQTRRMLDNQSPHRCDSKNYASESEDDTDSLFDTYGDESEMSMTMLIDDLHHPLKNLMDLSIVLQQTIERPIWAPLVPHANDCSTEALQTKFRASEMAYVYIRNLRDQFGNAPSYLVDRLGESNWLRHRRIKNQMTAVLELFGEVCDSDLEQDALITPAKSVILSSSTFHDSGLGTSLAYSSNAEVSVASNSSYCSSGLHKKSGLSRMPKLSFGQMKGKPFRCQFCGLIISVRTRAAWHIHVYGDLEPYICTFVDCPTGHTTFKTRKDWFDHEVTYHRTVTTLACRHDQCGKEFANVIAFTTHYKSFHHSNLKETQLPLLAETSRVYRFGGSEIEKCPLCLKQGWMSQEALATHVARHLENIACLCLPLDDDTGDEDSSDEYTDDGDVTDENVHQSTLDSVLVAPKLLVKLKYGKGLGRDVQRMLRLKAPRKRENSAIIISDMEKKDRLSQTDTGGGVMSWVESVGYQATPKTFEFDGEAEDWVTADMKPFAPIEVLKPKKEDKRNFPCLLKNYGCRSTFPTKNEWKRHISINHLALRVHRCDLCLAPSDFSRKDLFHQHLRRMHIDHIAEIDDIFLRCSIQIHEAPKKLKCGFCTLIFSDVHDCQDYLEHVGRHFLERAKVGAVNDSEDEKRHGIFWTVDQHLEDWLVKEGMLVLSHGGNFILKGKDMLDKKVQCPTGTPVKERYPEVQKAHWIGAYR